MKKMFLPTAIITLLIHGIVEVHSIQAQANEVTLATMSLEAYKASNDINDLKKAKTSIDKACAHESTKEMAKTWRYKSEIYTEIAFNNELKTEFPTASYTAYTALVDALDLEVKKLEAKGKPKHKIPARNTYTRDFEAVSVALYNGGADAFSVKDYESAHKHFIAILAINPKTSFFTKTRIQFKFKESEASRLAGVSAAKMGKMDVAEKLLLPALEKGEMDQEAAVSHYTLLANSYYDAGEEDKAKKLLAEARKKYPLNQGLLITEINYALAEGRLAELEDQLKQAVEADKDNVELLFVMGNMYDELFRTATEKGENKEATDYFSKSVDWYKQGLSKDAKHYNCAYSLGAIYVNNSNHIARKLNDMSDSNSDEYKQKSSQYDVLLKEALKYLLQAEEISPKEKPALIALKEVYARLADEDKFMEYKKKSEAEE